MYSTSQDGLLRYKKKAAFAAMVLKQGIYRSFNQRFADHISLIVDFLEKDYISYADAAFLYMLEVDGNPDLLQTIRWCNPKLNQAAMSVAEKLKLEGIQIGEEKGKALSIAKAMLFKRFCL